MSDEVDSAKLSEERKNYYDKWDKFAKEEVKKTEEELDEEKKAADEALGINKGPRSEAEKKDLDKREALKEAKKQWEDRELSEAAKKFLVEDLENVERVLDSVKLKWKPVIVLKNNKGCKLKIPHTLKHKLVKVFIENCENCEIDFEVSSITQHLEITNSHNCLIRIKDRTATVQLDLCKDVTVEYQAGLYIGEQVKLYHAAVSNLKVTTVDGHEHSHCYIEALGDDVEFKDELQFVTQFLGGKFVTKQVVRDRGNLPATEDEIKEKELSVKSYVREAELKKMGGTEAFKEQNYAQAAVFYTEAIECLKKAKQTSQLEADKDFSHVLLSNRAFCWQKLGHHDKAEEDSREAVELKPDYCKALFRLGLALHAQKKYAEAIPTLGKALKLEPKNEQIKQALGFAEVLMRKQMQASHW